jgi:hypothetical protein
MPPAKPPRRRLRKRSGRLTPFRASPREARSAWSLRMSGSDFVIVGAGPAGLAAAYELTRRGRDCVVLEQDGQMGGLSKTVNHRGYRCDIGIRGAFEGASRRASCVTGPHADQFGALLSENLQKGLGATPGGGLEYLLPGPTAELGRASGKSRLTPSDAMGRSAWPGAGGSFLLARLITSSVLLASPSSARKRSKYWFFWSSRPWRRRLTD